jgi:hypothetical protein
LNKSLGRFVIGVPVSRKTYSGPIILRDGHPIELTAKRLVNEVRFPIAWADQHALLGTGWPPARTTAISSSVAD